MNNVMDAPVPALDAAKWHLEVHLNPANERQLHGTTLIHPCESRKDAQQVFNRYRTRYGAQVGFAHYLAPGQPPQGPLAFGTATTPPHPDKWHMRVEYWLTRPVDTGTLPTIVVNQHGEHAQASADFERYRSAIVGQGGSIIYAALWPPAHAERLPITIVGRLNG